jgi:hypothetical protein
LLATPANVNFSDNRRRGRYGIAYLGSLCATAGIDFKENARRGRRRSRRVAEVRTRDGRGPGQVHLQVPVRTTSMEFTKADRLTAETL